MEEDYYQSLHKLFEAANPRSVKGDTLVKALKELYDEAKKDFDKLWKRPDGSRVYQLLFRRGSEELRNQLLDDFTPILFNVATTRFSYYIVISMIKNGTSAQRARLFNSLKGKFDTLLTHKIGCKVIDLLFGNTNQEQKQLLYMDFYGEEWKKEKKVVTFEEICKKGGTKKTAAVKCLIKKLRHAVDKGAGGYKLTHKLLMILGQQEPKELGRFATDFKEYAFTCEGSQAAIIAIQNANPNEIKMALKLLEPTPRKSVLPEEAANTAVPENTEEEENNEEEEQQQQEEQGEEEAEQANLDEEANEEVVDGENSAESASATKAVEEEAKVELNITAQIMNDQFAWRALCCAISYNSDIDVMKDEVIPNIFDFWEHIKGNKNAAQLLVRLVSVQPSVFHDLSFQKDTINEELKEYVMPILVENVLTSVNDLGMIPKGSFLVATLMKLLVQDATFGRFAEAVFTKENVVDKVLNKMVRTCVQIVGNEVNSLAMDAINEVGLAEVLKTPGAWIVKDLIPGNKKLESQVRSVVKKEKISGPAIENILNPNAKKDEKPNKRGPKAKK